MTPKRQRGIKHLRILFQSLRPIGRSTQTRTYELLKHRLQEKQSEKDITDATLQVDQVALLHDEPSLPSISLRELEPPHLDWIYEKGEYTTFGESHSVSQPGQSRLVRPH